jgi:hypothetical protein
MAMVWFESKIDQAAEAKDDCLSACSVRETSSAEM